MPCSSWMTVCKDLDAGQGARPDLLGKPIPEDWTRRDNENGPMALPPKPKGGGGLTAWRNTKEGFEAEAAGRRRWQEIEEEKKDRRTALMQAVEHRRLGEAPEAVIRLAEQFYDWLRESSPAAGPAAQTAGVATTEARPRTPPQAGALRRGRRPPGGIPARIPVPTPRRLPLGKSQPVRSRGRARSKPPPVPPPIPMSPDECDHKFACGGWLKTQVIEGQCPSVPRCGMSAVVTESRHEGSDARRCGLERIDGWWAPTARSSELEMGSRIRREPDQIRVRRRRSTLDIDLMWPIEVIHYERR